MEFSVVATRKLHTKSHDPITMILMDTLEKTEAILDGVSLRMI